MPPNPPSNAHGEAMRSMSLRDMQIPKSEKNNFLAPPLPNPGDAPGDHIQYNSSLHLINRRVYRDEWMGIPPPLIGKAKKCPQ